MVEATLNVPRFLAAWRTAYPDGGLPRGVLADLAGGRHADLADCLRDMGVPLTRVGSMGFGRWLRQRCGEAHHVDGRQRTLRLARRREGNAYVVVEVVS